jgi:hypothetical protein
MRVTPRRFSLRRSSLCDRNQPKWSLQNGPATPHPTHTRHQHTHTPEKTRRESPRQAYCKIWANDVLPARP